MKTKENCVYRFLNASNEVIYIGKCKKLQSRMSSHRTAHHLANEAYSEVRAVEYISYPSYMDAGIMERIFIAHYQPKYNNQLIEEGMQSIVNPAQLNLTNWELLGDYPNGFPLNESKRKRMGVLDKADFILFDGEGTVGEAYFYRIIMQNHKPKALKIVGCLVHIFEVHYDPEYIRELSQRKKEECEQFTKFPMRFIKQSEWEELKGYFNDQLKIPIIYKGYTDFWFGKERTPFRYHRANEANYEFDISVLVILGALEILTKKGLVDPGSVRGKTITIPEDFSNINLSKLVHTFSEL